MAKIDVRSACEGVITAVSDIRDEASLFELALIERLAGQVQRLASIVWMANAAEADAPPQLEAGVWQ